MRVGRRLTSASSGATLGDALSDIPSRFFMFRRRGSGLRAGNTCRDSTTDVAEIVTAASRQWLARPEIDRAPYLHLRDHLAKRGDAAQALPAQRLFKCRESAQHLQAQPSGIGGCSDALAGASEHV